MKKKERDQLLKAAFGDMDAKAKTEFEASLTSDDARRELEMLSQAKQDLVVLGDVPPCQLSKERLKKAILASSAKKAPAKNGWGWAAGSVGAAAAVIWAALVMTGDAPLIKSVEPVALNGTTPNDFYIDDLYTGSIDVRSFSFGAEAGSALLESAADPVPEGAVAMNRPRSDASRGAARSSVQPEVMMAAANTAAQPEDMELIASSDNQMDDVLVVISTPSGELGFAGEAMEVMDTHDVVFGG
jgi:hypothetical protein